MVAGMQDVKVKVFEQAGHRRIALLVRAEFEFADLDLKDTPPQDELMLHGVYPEESLFHVGVDVSSALPDLIQYGYHVCQQ